MARKPKGKDLPARPFLKWAGGKTQLLGALLEQVPEEIGTYYEPFVGGGALFFALREAGRLRSARLSDVNPELVNVWTVLRDAPYDVIGLLEKLSQRTGEEDFYEIRAQNPEAMVPAERAARLLYLNKTCFNGLYRENSKGIFNVPYGRYARPAVLDRENLLAVSKALQRVKIEALPFNKAVARAKAGDFVYFDPPYYPVSKSASFTAYARAGFAEQEQKLLAQLFGELAERGVNVLLSNSDTPFVRRLYERKGYEITRVEASRAINSKGDKRGKVGELLVRAGGPGKAKKRRGSAASRGSQLGIAFRRTLRVA